MNTYSYATDSDHGTIKATSLEAAYTALRAKITDAMIADGATLWVESSDGERLTMGVDRDGAGWDQLQPRTPTTQ